MVFDSMMKVVVFAIVSVIFILILKPNNPHIATILTLLVSCIIFLFITPFLEQVILFFNTFSDYMNYKTLYIDVVLKIICISYLCEFGAEICKDAGISSVATKIELGGKILIMCLSLPIISEVLKTVITIL